MPVPLIKTERRYALNLPFYKSHATNYSPDVQAERELLIALEKCCGDTWLFSTMQWQRVLTEEDIPVGRFVLDVFDRPIYVLGDLSGTRVWLQAPLCTGLETDEVASTLRSLRGHTNGLTYYAAPSGTLAVSVTYTFDGFVEKIAVLLPRFCNQSREAARNAREHLTKVRRKKLKPLITLSCLETGMV